LMYRRLMLWGLGVALELCGYITSTYTMCL